ncbi:MAG: sulfurtransferase [Gemmatimonadales bacterium]|jgi:thiosulfate/3-mercaptopyruvate sulfurtransferase
MSQVLVPVTDIAARGYAHPEVLVSTQWVADHLEDPAVRILESDEDTLLYETGHIPGAVKIDWVADLNEPLIRDYIDRAGFEQLLCAKGIGRDTTVVLYGDQDNWWATYAFWVFRLFGWERLRVMDGGRLRWAEEGRPLETAAVMEGGQLRWVPKARIESEVTLKVRGRDDTRIRALRDQVLQHAQAGRPLVDVRSPEEFRGERLHMMAYRNEGAVRGGHIPGARNIPWGRTIDQDTHTFRPASELRTIYEGEHGLRRDEDLVVYCRIGERSSHTWFALTYLLGFSTVRNYDGSWTEWGNQVGAPIQRP